MFLSSPCGREPVERVVGEALAGGVWREESDHARSLTRAGVVARELISSQKIGARPRFRGVLDRGHVAEDVELREEREIGSCHRNLSQKSAQLLQGCQRPCHI